MKIYIYELIFQQPYRESITMGWRYKFYFRKAVIVGQVTYKTRQSCKDGAFKALKYLPFNWSTSVIHNEQAYYGNLFVYKKMFNEEFII